MVKILVLAIVLGLCWWLITFLPLVEPFLTIIRVLIVLALLWEILALAGYVPSAINRTNPPG